MDPFLKRVQDNTSLVSGRLSQPFIEKFLYNGKSRLPSTYGTSTIFDEGEVSCWDDGRPLKTWKLNWRLEGVVKRLVLAVS
jgi:hypothetical protein|uniref:Uncharacterized protein n=1 Tax=Picea glauca TaxID=3330 RepID=A0A101LWL2_PICGL|nr:hypothetical protein ABT39_MTgene1387 [Picea glauca]QHR89459.1 hypothetical protein Q903MT_gene3480 [Picea sitchensis]